MPSPFPATGILAPSKQNRLDPRNLYLECGCDVGLSSNFVHESGKYNSPLFYLDSFECRLGECSGNLNNPLLGVWRFVASRLVAGLGWLSSQNPSDNLDNAVSVSRVSVARTGAGTRKDGSCSCWLATERFSSRDSKGAGPYIHRVCSETF